jgi:hypothetical protein
MGLTRVKRLVISQKNGNNSSDDMWGYKRKMSDELNIYLDCNNQ